MTDSGRAAGSVSSGGSAAPSVRAHFLKLSLRALGRCEPGVYDAARQRLGERVARIEDASALAWLPIEHLLVMSELAHELGDERVARQVVLDTMGLACAAPPWGSVVRWTVSVFGLGPPAVARWAPPLYRLAFRGTGRMTVPEVSATRARVVFHGVPAVCVAKDSYVRALGYALEFFFVLAEVPGDVQLQGCHAHKGELEFLLRCEGGPP